MFQVLSFRTIVLIFGLLFVGGFVLAEENLESEINAKTEELKKIHQQIQETQEQLFEAEKKKTSLHQTINRSNYNINQLNLSIKSSLINTEKLELEIESLGINIQDIQRKIEIKIAAVNDILRELQIKGNESLVVIFLKNQSLAESLGEIQNLAELRGALAGDVNTLKTLKQSLNHQVDQVSNKKISAEQESKSSQIKKSLLEDEREDHKQLLALTKSQAEAYEKLIDNLAQRQEEIAREVENLEANLRKQINTDLLPPERPGVLALPVQDFKKITQGYGATTFARYGYKGQWHNGLDFGAPLGTPILSAGEGLVVNIGDQDKFCRKGAYGKYIVIRHSNNLVTLYAHLSQIAVSPGDKIDRGGLIGYIGSTGYSTGPHLHFTVYDGNTFQMRSSQTCGPMPSGGDINPGKYL